MQSEVIVNVKDVSADDIVVPDTSADTPNTGYLSVDGSMDANTAKALEILLVIFAQLVGVCLLGGTLAES